MSANTYCFTSGGFSAKCNFIFVINSVYDYNIDTLLTIINVILITESESYKENSSRSSSAKSKSRMKATRSPTTPPRSVLVL